MVDAIQIQNFTNICVLEKSNSQNDFLSSSTTFCLRAHGMINLCLLLFILFSKGKVARSEVLFPLFSYIQMVQCTLVCITTSIPLTWNLFRWYSHAHVPSCAKSYPATFILKEEDLDVDLHQEDKNIKWIFFLKYWHKICMILHKGHGDIITLLILLQHDDQLLT